MRKYKGDDRPINPEQHRVAVIAGLQAVDYAFLFNERRNAENIKALKPNFYFKAGDYTPETMTSTEVVERHGGKAVIIPPTKGVSTSKMIEKITAVYGAKPVIEEGDATHVDYVPSKKALAIILDRDGTINEDVHYLHEPEKFKLLENAGEGMKKLQDMGFKLVINTLQAGIGLGYFTKEDFYKINGTMFKALKPYNIMLSKIYFCPHSFEDKCECRKPGTKLIELAKEQLNLDLENSYMIGDKTSDVEAGRRAGMKTILVETGKGGKDKEFDAKPNFVAKDLLDAAQFILREERK